MRRTTGRLLLKLTKARVLCSPLLDTVRYWPLFLSASPPLKCEPSPPGLGGMHSLIAAADLNYQKIDYYAHVRTCLRGRRNALANFFSHRTTAPRGLSTKLAPTGTTATSTEKPLNVESPVRTRRVASRSATVTDHTPVLAGNDTYVEYFPAGPDYAFAGTAFYYSGTVFGSSSATPNRTMLTLDVARLRRRPYRAELGILL